MALEKKLIKDDNEYKYDFPEVYYKIDDLFIDIANEKVRIGVRGYANQYARQNSGMGIYKKRFDIDLAELKAKSFSVDDIKTASYEYLKTLDEFKDAQSI